MPAKEFFAELAREDKAKVLELFNWLAQTGRIPSEEKFKRVESMWEFKRFQVRFLGDYRPGKLFVVAHGVRKKKNRHKRSDINKALRILKENDENAQA